MTDKEAILAAIVKPLVWVLDPAREPDFPKWTATGFGATYSVFKAWWGAERKWGYVGEDGFCHTPEAAQAAAEADYRARIAAALNLDAVAELVEAGRTLEAALQGDSLGDVDGALDAFDATLSAFTSTSRSRPGKANINNAVMLAAQNARDVFEGHKRAKEAVDYMEQLLLARFRGQP